LGFNVVDYGCTTCIGNSGPLPEAVHKAVTDGKLVASSLLSGHRHFAGRLHPDVKANYLASPPLVVAYALAGSTAIDLTKEPLGTGRDGKPVYLSDGSPSQQEVADLEARINDKMFASTYADVFNGNPTWNAVKLPEGDFVEFAEDSTHIPDVL